MAQSKWQKMKMLKMLEILNTESSAEAPLTSKDICARMAGYDIVCDKRNISKDIALLNEFGYEVESVFRGHEKAYYIEQSQLTRSEIKILMDAVEAATFLPEKESNNLIEKLQCVNGKKKAVQEAKTIHFNRNKHTNEDVYASVGKLSTALRKHRQASFLYFDRDEDANKIYRKDGNRYIVDPVCLVYNDDRYYLMCVSEKYENFTVYRVDRMDEVHAEGCKASEKANVTEEQIADYVEQTFGMFGGALQDVAIQFDQSLIGVIQDKFGESTKMIRLNKNTCIATLKVQISPTFWGWVFQFAGKMKIIAPDEIVAEYKARAMSVVE